MVKVSEAWKDLERKVALKLGGKRVVRENFSMSSLDIEHPWLAIDAKWRTNLAVASWYKKLVRDSEKLYGKEGRVPILVVKQKNMKSELVVIDIDDFIKVVNEEKFKIEPKGERLNGDT